MSENYVFPQPISEKIWADKYAYKPLNSDHQGDTSIEDTWRRIAVGCSSAIPELTTGFEIEKDFHKYQGIMESNFYEVLKDFSFLPAGRIIAGSGTPRDVTLFNCYVMGNIPDNMGGIFDSIREAALTLQQGGGVGFNFSTIRPKNAPVKGVDAFASGPLSFMDVWDSMCRTIMSAGARRGAMMGTLLCDHPDIEDFIKAKQDPTKLRMFNLSVLITDAFMKAVKDNADWLLCHAVAPTKPVEYQPDPISPKTISKVGEKYIYKVIKAKALWNLIMDSTYNYAEPGVIFIDRINQKNTLWYTETITATNPCGEQPLPPYGACLLGSVNLTKIVKNPFTPGATFDGEILKSIVKRAVRLLDSVIDTSKFPLVAQEEEAKRKRRMGIGVTGLADMLLMANVTYGSKKAADIAEALMKLITISAYEESIELAKLFGPCPAVTSDLQRQKFIDSGFMKKMPSYIKEGILNHGIRNSHLTSIAPTGTISLLAGNVSSGIEPIFAESYTRKVLEPDGSKREELVEDYAVHLHRVLTGEPLDSKHLVTAQNLTPQDHLVMQTAVQKWVDSSISKTINCPEDISFEDFSNVYMTAYDSDCNGCTTYRPNDVTGSILSVEPTKKEEVKPPPIPVSKPLIREDELEGSTYKLKWLSDTTYLTINDSVDRQGKRIPFELFINSKQVEHHQWAVALTRTLSAIFRRGGDVSFIVEELRNVFDPKGGMRVKGKYVPSLIALIGETINTHLKKIGYIEEDIIPEVKKPVEASTSPAVIIQCVDCKGCNVHHEAGCLVCKDCGSSKCG